VSEPAAPDVEHPDVTEALRKLADVDLVALNERATLLEDAHRLLRDALSTIDAD
jgi:hypothetical protein